MSTASQGTFYTFFKFLIGSLRVFKGKHILYGPFWSVLGLFLFNVFYTVCQNIPKRFTGHGSRRPTTHFKHHISHIYLYDIFYFSTCWIHYFNFSGCSFSLMLLVTTRPRRCTGASCRASKSSAYPSASGKRGSRNQGGVQLKHQKRVTPFISYNVMVGMHHRGKG